MIELPDSCQVGRQGKTLNKKLFFVDSLTTAERRRLRECLKKVILTHQIAGETIASLIDERYHCAVILHIEIELSDLKQKDFVAKVIQPLMKPLAVFRFFDASGGRYALSFAHKQLKVNEPDSIRIASSYCTATWSETSPAPATLAFASLVNRNNKRDLYLEAMTKAFLIDHPKLFIGADSLLSSPLWYDGKRILELYESLIAIHSLKLAKSTAKSNAEKANSNKALKAEIDQVKAQFLPPSPATKSSL